MFAVRDESWRRAPVERVRGLMFDRVEALAGARFGCRHEAYFTDSRSERMEIRSRVELTIRSTDGPS